MFGIDDPEVFANADAHHVAATNPATNNPKATFEMPRRDPAGRRREELRGLNENISNLESESRQKSGDEMDR